MQSTNNVELIEKINEQLETAGALGSAYSSIAWSYAGSYLNATLALRLETDPDRVKKLEARCGELAAIAGWANSLALPDYRPTVDQLVERVGKTQAVMDDETLLEAKATLTGLDKATLQLAMKLNERDQAERAALQKRALEMDEQGIRKLLAIMLHASMDAGFDLSERDAVRIAERLSEKAKAAKDRALMQVVRARQMNQITRAVAEIKLLEDVIPKIEALYHRFAAEIEAASARAPVEEATAELVGTDEHETPRWVQRAVS